MKMTLKVGLIVGREWSFPPAFIEEVNRRDQGVTAEYVKLGAPRMDDPCEYAVIIDRISHEVPFYRTYLKQAALAGCAVVNNPFMWTADDKFFGAALATSLGIAHPKTVVLPNKEYIPGIVHEESLRNLQYPLDWQGIVEYVGLPCILKDAHGGGWKDVYVCRSLEELIHHYDTSGLLTMIVQEFIEWDQFIRCICIGQDKVMPIKYDPKERKYHVEHEHLTPELGQRVIADSLKLVRALGYDMNSMEWAVRDGIPYAIDFMNPAPDMDIYSLTPHYFEWAISAMADMAIDLAKNPRRQVRDLRWDALFTHSREGGGGASTAQDTGPGGGTAFGPGFMGGGGRGEGGGTDPGSGSPSSGSGDPSGAPSGGGEGGGSNAPGGSSHDAQGGSSPIQGAPNSVVDASPAADLEPAADASQPPHGGDERGGVTADGGGPAGSKEGGNGRSAAGEGGRAGEDTSPDAASRSAQEQA
ncbi:hypothetical protein [Longimicrobium sp.]|uniref:ATP-grasp domain-containing protein n=1 Tax=Longimicrobium sp. TaxID=2029185 RepID=UPI002C54C1D7|nr:hypothetical protein [Longimicrobium sp.]HSU15365.1 hypothetical protein [Longimicrobium sp.]